MKSRAVVALFALVLSAAPVLAQTPPQTPAGQPAPAQTPPAAQAPAPAAPAAQAAVPLPPGAKFAYVNLQSIVQQSNDGKAAAQKYQGEGQRKQAEMETRGKALQASQQKLQTGGSLMTADARAQLEKDIERQQREAERFEQDAQAELSELQTSLQADLNRKIFPILAQMGKEKGLSLLFSAVDSGLLWAEPGLDLTADAVRLMDAAPPITTTPPAAKPAAASTPAARPTAAPAPATAKPAVPAKPAAGTTKP